MVYLDAQSARSYAWASSQRRRVTGPAHPIARAPLPSV